MVDYKGLGTLLAMLYKETIKSWDTYNWVLICPTLSGSKGELIGES